MVQARQLITMSLDIMHRRPDMGPKLESVNLEKLYKICYLMFKASKEAHMTARVQDTLSALRRLPNQNAEDIQVLLQQTIMDISACLQTLRWQALLQSSLSRRMLCHHQENMAVSSTVITSDKESSKQDFPHSDMQRACRGGPATPIMGETVVHGHYISHATSCASHSHEVCQPRFCWMWSNLTSVFTILIQAAILMPVVANNSSVVVTNGNLSVSVLNDTVLFSHAVNITESSANATVAIATQNLTLTTSLPASEDNSNVTLVNSLNLTDSDNVTFYTENVTVRALAVQHSGIAVGGIVGITIASIVFTLIFSFIVIYLVTQRRAKNAAEGKGNHSKHYTGLNDDNIMLSYINSQFDVPKDSQEEMISLDNDAYLNSLESMIASNWTTQRSNTRF